MSSARGAATDLRPPRRYVLPQSLRAELARPFGPVVTTEKLSSVVSAEDFILAVGDVVSLTLKRMDIKPRLFVCDYQTQRGEPDPAFELELGSWGELAFQVRNPAATITREAWDAIRLGLAHERGPVRVLVEGEEDMLGIPCFLEAPQGAKVLYGMPGKGVVVAEVSTEFQARVADLLSKFTRE